MACAKAETIHQMEKETLQNVIRLFLAILFNKSTTDFMSIDSRGFSRFNENERHLLSITFCHTFFLRINNSANSAENGMKTAITRLFTFDKRFRNVLKPFDCRAIGRDPNDCKFQTI